MNERFASASEPCGFIIRGGVSWATTREDAAKAGPLSPNTITTMATANSKYSVFFIEVSPFVPFVVI
jgi:hypothetical protein